MAAAPREACFGAECVVGRLVEARLEYLTAPADVARFVVTMQAAFAKAGPGCVICADWRTANVLAPDVGDALIDLLRRGNRHFARSGLLLPAHSPTFVLQVERLLREAGNPERRAFTAPQQLLAWIGERLSPSELQRATDFLNRPPG
jgi:hypothetical protein